MIQNRNMSRQARTRTAILHFDLSGTTAGTVYVCEPLNDIRITSVHTVYLVATSSDAQTEGVTVGTKATAALYGTFTPVVSKAVLTSTEEVVASTALLPAGTPLVIARTAASGSSNTGETLTVVKYELIDK